MRRLARHLFTLCSAVSLALLLAACVMWVRSYRVMDWAWRGSVQGRRDATGIATEPGTLTLFSYWKGAWEAAQDSENLEDGDNPFGEQPRKPRYGKGLHHFSVDVDEAYDTDAHPELMDVPGMFYSSESWDRWGVRVGVHRASLITEGDESESGGAIVGFFVGVRCWLAAVLLAVLPASWTVATLRTRRAKRSGLCPACGYDLRATPGRCPECGTAAGT